MAEQRNATLYKAELGEELRRLREAAGLDRDDAARALGCSDRKIYTIEKGQVSVRLAELYTLLDAYGVAGDERGDIEHLARLARHRRPRTSWGSAVPERVKRFFATEETAAVIRVYQPMLLHGLVQTERYARAVIGTNSSLSPTDVERLVQARMARQERLTGEDPPTVHLVVEEHVLRARVGGFEVMREQLEHLADLAGRGVVELRVAPTSLGAHPCIGAPLFLVLTPEGGRRPNVVYVETLTDGVFVDESDRIARYETTISELLPLTLSPSESLSLLSTVMTDL